jgi:hypothetical protein
MSLTTNKRAKSDKMANEAVSRAKRLPAEVQPLIRKNIIDLSGASHFFKKKAGVATLLKGFVEALPNS